MSLMPFLFTGRAALRSGVLQLLATKRHAWRTTQKKALLRQRLLQYR
jgi:hypothetical protein